MNTNIKAKNLLDLGLGVAIGTCAIMTADIELSIAAMDLADPSTLPNMHPAIRYPFIPVIALGIYVVAVPIEVLFFRVLRPRTTTRLGWLLLGCSYSLIAIDLVLRHFTVGGLPSALGIALFASSTVSIHFWLYEKSSA